MAEELKAFKREDRYIVLKLSDLSALPEVVGRPFAENLTAIQRRLPKRECLVIESDWPEYQVAWQMIEERISGSAQLPSQGGEAVEVVAHLVLGGIFHGGSGPELGDIDYQIEVGVAERLQLENVKTSEDLQLELMTVAQHQRILAASAGSGEAVGEVHPLSDGKQYAALYTMAGQHLVGEKLYTRPADQVAEPDAELVELLREARELIEHGDFREGHCMCGSAVEAHGFGDGHSPVDAGVYYAGQVMERIDAKLASLEVKP